MTDIDTLMEKFEPILAALIYPAGLVQRNSEPSDIEHLSLPGGCSLSRETQLKLLGVALKK